jgi:general secretion pathway protein C
MYWALKFVQGTATPANAAVVTAAPLASVDGQALARGLGGGLGAMATAVASPVAAPTGGIIASRFVLSGVVEGKTARQSLALIAVDGKPARPYRVGAQLAEGVVLAAVQRRQALLSPNTGKAGAVTLELVKANATGIPAAIAYTPPVQLPPVVVANPVQSPAVVTPDPMSPVPPGLGGNPARAGGPGPGGRTRAMRDAARDAAGGEQAAPAVANQ